MTDLHAILDQCSNLKVAEAIIKANAVIGRHFRINCSVSGGSDSDIMIDILEKVKDGKEINYSFYDTGVEYEATKRHLDYLEQRYGIKINRIKAEKPIPYCLKKYGQPFLSKYASEQISRAQTHNFGWEIFDSYEEIDKAYPDLPMATKKWWTNDYAKDRDRSKFDINHNRFLRDFLHENPPWFPISKKCCTYAKKNPAHKYVEEIKADLQCVGVRQAEGGIRAVHYKSCFDKGDYIDNFRPVFWLSDKDKRNYEETFGIVHSDCYTKYGFRRTGCAGCPYNLQLFRDLEAIREYEPKFYAATNSMFADTYKYTRMYRDYCAERRAKEKMPEGQILIFEWEAER